MNCNLEFSLDCRGCRLCGNRTRVVVPDGLSTHIIAVGEAPGREEDAAGIGFVGRAGRNLDAAFAAAGVGREQYARANVVRCRPPGNRRPKVDEIRACAEWLGSFVQYAVARNRDAGRRPPLLLAVGQTAAVQLCGTFAERASYLRYCEDQLWRIQAGGYGAAALPLYHEAAVLAMPHTSPLSWNRRYSSADGPLLPVRDLGERLVRLAVEISGFPSG